jgi:hypothetical protein
MAQMEAFNAELKRAAVMKDCDALRPSREGKRVRLDGQSWVLVDGPFEGDLVGGLVDLGIAKHRGCYCMVKRCPNPKPVPSEIEIRPI